MTRSAARRANRNAARIALALTPRVERARDTFTIESAQAISRTFDVGAVNYPFLAELLNRVSTKAMNRSASAKHPTNCHFCNPRYLHPLLAGSLYA